MSQFMAEFSLPTYWTEEFNARIPAQRQKVNALLRDGRVASYALAADHTRLWCVVNADTETEAFSIIAEFPLIDFVEPRIYELQFNNVVAKLPLFSLN